MYPIFLLLAIILLLFTTYVNPLLHLLDYTAEDGRITILVADDHTGVDYNSVYGQLEDGNKIYPVEYNSQVGSVEFDVPNQNFTLYVYDIEGNMIDVNFTL